MSSDTSACPIRRIWRNVPSWTSTLELESWEWSGSTTRSCRGLRVFPARLNRQSEVVEEAEPVDPIQGASLYLTLDLNLQEVVEQALESGLFLANEVKNQDRAEGLEITAMPPGERRWCMT